MTSQLSSYSIRFDIEYHDGTIYLWEIVSLVTVSDRMLKRTLPDAKKSPLRLNLSIVACPDPIRTK